MDARERVLEAAEQLFAERGYAAVTLRDIAARVGIRHASLYHHVPGGKEELFVEVTERGFRRHHHGLAAAIRDAGPSVRARLCAAADWFLSQPPIDVVRMANSDMPAIDPAVAYRLSEQMYAAALHPIEQVLMEAERRGELRGADHGLMAGAIFGMVQSLYGVPAHALSRTREAMAHEVIDVLLDGLHPR